MELKRVGAFDAPVYVTGAPGFPRLLFVVEQPGRIAVLKHGHRAGAFLDIEGLVDYGGERGLLSVAFPPDYARSKRFYVYYTDSNGDNPGRRIPAPHARPGPPAAPAAR